MQPQAAVSAGLTDIESSPLYNADLAPVPPERRTWGTYNYAALWVSMAHCIPTYMLASGLIGAGMSWQQALVTILIGNSIVLVPILLNSHPGTKYGIPFPVFARASYGTVGSNLPALMRAIVACGWFGIQAWIGGQALHVFFRSVWPAWPAAIPGSFGGHAPTEWISFLLFWGLNILVVYRGMDLLRKVENWAAPFVLVMTSLLVWWAIRSAHGLGPILAQKGKFATFHEFWPVFVPSVTAMIGFWATLSLNIPDFSRYAKSQKDQMWGQALGLPLTMGLYSFIGVAVTSATVVIYGKSIWDPVELIANFKNPVVLTIALVSLVLATLATNIAANVVGPANDFAHLWPEKIDFRIGGYITGIIGILIQPWKLIADPSGYIFKWLVAYSSLLGSVGGILIADYFLIRGGKLDVRELYEKNGEYWYVGGVNGIALLSLVLGVAPVIPGFLGTVGLMHVEPYWISLYNYAWFISFGISFAAYRVFMKWGENS
jgi:nucleobase:cation symporter-1, NCS1 family